MLLSLEEMPALYCETKRGWIPAAGEIELVRKTGVLVVFSESTSSDKADCKAHESH